MNYIIPYKNKYGNDVEYVFDLDKAQANYLNNLERTLYFNSLEKFIIWEACPFSNKPLNIVMQVEIEKCVGKTADGKEYFYHDYSTTAKTIIEELERFENNGAYPIFYVDNGMIKTVGGDE